MRSQTRTSTRNRCLWLILAGMLTAASAQAASEAEQQAAIDRIVGKVTSQLKQTKFPAKDGRRAVTNIAVLSIAGDDDGYAKMTLKSAIANTTYRLFSRDESEIDRIHKEILEYSKTKRGDIMDANTVQEWGSVQGVDAVMYGRLWRQDEGEAKTILFLSHVETGELLWSSGPVTSHIAEKAPEPTPSSPVQQKAMDQVVEIIRAKLNTARARKNWTERNVAVLPILGDEDGYARLALKSAVANSTLRLFSRDEAELDRIHAEIRKFSKSKRGDIMDANTIQRFGRVQGVEAVLYGQMWPQGDGNVKLNVFCASVESGEVLWSSKGIASSIGDRTVPKAPDPKIQKAMDQVMKEISSRLDATSFPQDGSRRAVESIAVLEMVGDPGDYARSGLQAAVANTHYKAFTRDSDELRRIQQEIIDNDGFDDQGLMDPQAVQRFGKIQGVDAVMYGRVWRQDKDLQGNRGNVKVQVFLAHVETGEVLWSSGPVEAQAYSDWTTLLEKYWIYPAVAVGALLVLVILGRAIKSATRPR